MRHTTLTGALCCLARITLTLAAKKNIIVDTDLFSDVE